MFFLANIFLVEEMDGEIFCYIHQGGELVKGVDGSVEYKGGSNDSMTFNTNISYDQFVSQLCSKLKIKANEVEFHFTVKFDPSCQLPLNDDASLARMFRFNDMFCRIYLSPCAEAEAEAGVVARARYILADHNCCYFHQC